jgi:hypothetical protein
MTEPIHRYILFAGDTYYANGGALDIRGFGTEKGRDDLVNQGLAFIKRDGDDMSWFHVYDMKTEKIVAFSDGLCGGRVDSHLMTWTKNMIAEDCEVYVCKSTKEPRLHSAFVGETTKVWFKLEEEEREEFINFVRRSTPD